MLKHAFDGSVEAGVPTVHTCPPHWQADLGSAKYFLFTARARVDERINQEEQEFNIDNMREKMQDKSFHVRDEL